MDYWFINLPLQEDVLKYYFGVGGFFTIGSIFNLGIHFPIGLQILAFKNFNFFTELSPGIPFLPSLGINLQFNFGGRYYFK